MYAYIVKRILATIPVMAVVAVFVFGLLHLTPGDPAAIIAGDYASPADIEGIREERALRLWINFLGIENVFIDNLYKDLKDGLVLCKVIHRIDDKVVEWPRVNKQRNLGRNVHFYARFACFCGESC